MIVGIVASRGLHIEDLEPYIPAEASKLVTAGYDWLDAAATAYATRHGIPHQILYPNAARDAQRYRRVFMSDGCDLLLVLSHGRSATCTDAVKYAEEAGRQVRIRRL